MREVFKPEFYELWDKGFNYYLKGDWNNAKKIFEKTQNFIPNHKDGPSITLLDVIKNNNGKAPDSWNGFRALTEK